MYEQESFTWFIPQKETGYALTFPNKDHLTFNSKVLGNLPQKVRIGVSDDATAIMIVPDENGFNIPKSGNVKCPQVIEYLLRKKIDFGARYELSIDGTALTGKLNTKACREAKLPKTPKNIKFSSAKRIVEEMKSR